MLHHPAPDAQHLDRLVLARLQRLGIASTDTGAAFAPRKALDLSPTASTSHGSASSESERDGFSASSSSVSSAPASILSFSNSLDNDVAVTIQSTDDAETRRAHEFYASQSRVVRLYNLPAMAESFLAQVFLPHNDSPIQRTYQAPVPMTMWELKDADLLEKNANGIWAVFRTHDEASSALSLSGRAMSVAPALESDLEPFSKLRRVTLQPTLPPTQASSSSSASITTSAVHRLQHQLSLNNPQAPIDLPPPASLLQNTTRNTPHNTTQAHTHSHTHTHTHGHHLRRISASLSDLQTYQKEQEQHEQENTRGGLNAFTAETMVGSSNGALEYGALEYTLSSNPPNPKTNFRLGDWICPSTNCAAHNFGRNLSCIGCGCPRSTPTTLGANHDTTMMSGNFNSSFAGPGQHDLLRPPFHQHNLASSTNRAISSPRFSNNSNQIAPPPPMSSQQSNGSANVFYSSAPPPPPAFVQQAQHLQSQQRDHPLSHSQSPQHPHHQHPHHPQQHQHSSHSQHRAQQLPPPPPPSSSSLLPHIAIGHPSGHSTAHPASINIGPGSGAINIGMHSTIGGGSSGGMSGANPTGGASGHAGKQHSHPLLTPSGRAFAVGGKVQNVSSDPLTPCIMYWPDNEPFPEQGQIRPNNLVGVAPPILNTGNRGPISHQPGDWICQKCNYLNWRRRKVCQTCLPYAEGNGDSISAAVQAERIALLTSVLAQTNINGLRQTGTSPSPAPHSLSAHGQRPLHHQASHHQLIGSSPASHQLQPHHHGATQTPRSHSMTPPQERRPFIELLPPSTRSTLHQTGSSAGNTLSVHRPVHRSQSHFALGQQYSGTSHLNGSSLHGGPQTHGGLHPHYSASSPIYQTSGHRQEPRQPSPLYMTGPDVAHRQRGHTTSELSHQALERFSNSSNVRTVAPTPTSGVLTGGLSAPQQTPAPAPLLPSFLQDMVQSPALSPTSTTTSSADLSSIEEYDELSPPAQQRSQQQQGQHGHHQSSQQHGSQHAMFPRARGDSGSSVAAADALSIGLGAGAGAGIGSTGLIVGRPSEMLPPSLGNIWRLDGEETKSLNAFPLPNHQELVGARKSSKEGLRGTV